MQIKWLEDLLALAEAGSFVRAAQRRHVTHPAFGRRIRALEAWAGAALVDRDAPTLRFTPQGVALLEAARDAVAALTAARRPQDGADGDRPIRIATGRTLARTLLATWYGAMQGLLADRQLAVTTRTLPEVAALLEAGDADFMLTYYHPMLALRLDARRFTHLRLADERLVPVSGPAADGRVHALSRRGAAPWLAYSSTLALGRLVDDHLASHLKPPRLRKVIEIDSADAAHEFALRGFGIAWLPLSMVAADCRSGRLQQVGDRSHEIRLEVRLYRPRRRLLRLAEALWVATSERALG
jgi:DNA-binding transcriptional LysR family regulator